MFVYIGMYKVALYHAVRCKQMYLYLTLRIQMCMGSTANHVFMVAAIRQ